MEGPWSPSNADRFEDESYFPFWRRIHEYGPQTTTLPFLGRDFKGFEGVKQYSNALSDTLDIIRMEWIELVAEQNSSGLGGVVFTKGLGTFTVKRTQKDWKETYINRIEVNEDGKIVRYEVFAVSGLTMGLFPVTARRRIGDRAGPSHRFKRKDKARVSYAIRGDGSFGQPFGNAVALTVRRSHSNHFRVSFTRRSSNCVFGKSRNIRHKR